MLGSMNRRRLNRPYHAETMQEALDPELERCIITQHGNVASFQLPGTSEISPRYNKDELQIIIEDLQQLAARL